MLTRLACNTHRRRPSPDKIAHGLMGRIRNLHRRQLTGSMQLRQHHRNAPVRLHPVACLHRDERGGHNDAVVPHLDRLAMQAVAAGTRFIAEMQPRSASCEPLHQLADVIGTMRHRPQMADLTTALALRDCDRDRRLVDIQPDERAILHAVSDAFLRPGTSQSGATLEPRMPRERLKTQSARTAIMGSRPVATPEPLPGVTPERRSGREAGQATRQGRGADNHATRQNDIDGPRARLKPPEAKRVSRNGQKSRCSSDDVMASGAQLCHRMRENAEEAEIGWQGA
jgi:hypothetical protein